MRIESQIDVITNSSTEVFMAYNDTDMNSLRTIISGFIELMGLPKEANNYIIVKRNEQTYDYEGMLDEDESDDYTVEFKHSKYDKELTKLLDLLRDWKNVGEMKYCYG